MADGDRPRSQFHLNPSNGEPQRSYRALPAGGIDDERCFRDVGKSGLRRREVEIHEAGHRLIYTSDDQTDAPISAGSDYATQAFGDMFLDYIRKELNRSYAQGLHLATMFLARKLLEAFERDWETFYVVPLDEALLMEASALVIRQALGELT